MARLAPLVRPPVTRGRGCGPHGLSLHYLASLGSDHGFTGPRVGVVPLPGAEQNVFRMARLAPLVSPRVTRGRGCGPLGLSLHYIASWVSDHGIHWSTGWGCKRLGGIRKHFRMTRVLPLLVSLPTAPPGCFDVGLSHLSALRGGCIAPPGGLFYIFEDNHLQKKIRL